jgi:hypothetical protein
MSNRWHSVSTETKAEPVFLLLIKVAQGLLVTLADGKFDSSYAIGGNAWIGAKQSRRALRCRYSVSMRSTTA